MNDNNPSNAPVATGPAQTVLAPHASSPGVPSWADELNMTADIHPSFFRPDSKKQRVLVMNVIGHGPQGKRVTLRQKDNAGNPVSKEVACFATVSLLEESTMRSLVWEVLSRSTCAQLLAAVVRAGPGFRGTLAVYVWAEGRGMNRTTFVQAVPIAQAAEAPEDAEADAEAQGDAQ